MKAKAFLIASLFAISFTLTACGSKTEDTQTIDSAATETAPSSPTIDTAATVAPSAVDSSATAMPDSAAPAADTAAH